MTIDLKITRVRDTEITVYVSDTVHTEKESSFRWVYSAMNHARALSKDDKELLFLVTDKSGRVIYAFAAGKSMITNEYTIIPSVESVMRIPAPPL